MQFSVKQNGYYVELLFGCKQTCLTSVLTFSKIRYILFIFSDLNFF